MDTTVTTGSAGGTAVRRRRRLVAAGVAAVAILAILAVVAWRLVGGPDLQRLAGAADATIEAGTARVAVVGTVEGVPLLGPFTLTVAEGEVDLARQRALLRREVPGVSGVPGLRRLLPEPVELLHDGSATYLRLPVDGERAWVRVTDPPDDPTADPGTVAPGLTNPVAALGLLRALDGLPETLGREDVRGQPSTHLRVTVDLDEAAQALSGRAEDVARALRRMRGRADLPMEVWLDGDDRVTRLRWAVDTSLAGISRISLLTDLELHDFGVAVDIRPPDAGDVVDASPERLRELNPLDRLRAFLDR